MEHLHTVEGKSLRAAEKAELSVAEAERKPDGLEADAAKALAGWLKQTLGDKVREVRVSQRLVDSPAVVLDSDKFVTSTMRRVLRAAHKPGEQAPPGQQDLEINPQHPILIRLEQMRHREPDLAAKVAEQVWDNARVAAGVLDDPRTMLKRLNELLEKILTANG
jgi:molecular chaperone HtpG